MWKLQKNDTIRKRRYLKLILVDLWMVIGIAVLFCVVPFISSPYMFYVLNMIGIAAIAAIGLNILIGYNRPKYRWDMVLSSALEHTPPQFLPQIIISLFLQQLHPPGVITAWSAWFSYTIGSS